MPLLSAAGSVQMATDTALLAGLHAGTSPPTLRFYTWEPACLSLGFHQALDPAWQQLAWVRRPTGGRAVWHAGDLSYALTAYGLEGRTVEVYSRLSAFLFAGFARLGIPLAYGRGGREYVRNRSCFAGATSSDLVHEGRKLIGSAQVRRGPARLQHGSILLAPDRAAMSVLFESPAAVVGLSEIAPAISVEQLVEVLAYACSEVLATPVPGELSDSERQAIARLLQETG